MTLDPALLALLACPSCKSPVEYRKTQRGEWLVCTSETCKLAYAIRDDIPIMLVDEAVPEHEIEEPAGDETTDTGAQPPEQS